MKKLLIIILLLVVIIWMGYNIIELESFRYATLVGYCSNYQDQFTMFQERYDCLSSTETRTHWFYHILFGLGIL